MSSDEEAKLLIEYMTTALRRKLNMSETQVFPAIAPDYSLTFGNPNIQVVLGAATPYGEGRGAQDGGALLRQQTVTLNCFLKLNLDQQGQSQQFLVNAHDNLTDLFKSIRKVFAFTCFPTTPEPQNVDDFLLFEPLKWGGESPTIWEDPIQYVAHRTISFNGVYGVHLPSQPSLVYGDFL
jgi:hypothetical protein